MNVDELFANRVEEILQNHEGNDLIFFKGFSISQISYLIGHPCSLLDDSELVDCGTIDVEILNNKWFELMTAVRAAQEVKIGFYEELLLIQEGLPRVSHGKVVVYENNILTPWAPSCVSYEDIRSLAKYHQGEKEATDGKQKILAGLYGDVRILSKELALVLPTLVADGTADFKPFWPESGEMGIQTDAEEIECNSMKDWQYRADLLQNEPADAVFVFRGASAGSQHKALAWLLRQLGVPYEYKKHTQVKEKYYDEETYVPILKKYWGENAEFRDLKFYKDPDRSQEVENISQGKIIAEIVEQCKLAMEKKLYNNIFITAPTGAGKSILFQLPALYMAGKYDLVTIVVSPLIALMNDQVAQLEKERGISIAACINSSMSFDERLNVIEKVKNKEKSLLYLAPELLMTTHLESFLGGRRVGMVVIDEAHTVTSWGRDFRSDYWFLGDFLNKVKQSGMKFPVLCLTATAVYSGENDVVNDTIAELGLERTIVHLGNVRRENITFDIQKHPSAGSLAASEREKKNMILSYMRRAIEAGEKVLTYCPYTTQVNDLYEMLNKAEHHKIRRYHAKLADSERTLSEQSYRTGEAMGLICTKAFGMGIDVGDVRHIVHFAPSGTLADYVQEIGRAARNQGLQGIAHIDYFPTDMLYVRRLNGMSEMRQYQLAEMLKKLSAIQRKKNKQNLLISVETFDYLFREREVENRTKSGLMLLAKDLNNKCTFPVLIVRPKAMLSKNYVHVPCALDEKFQREYGEYAQLQGDSGQRTVQSGNYTYASDITISSEGKTYLVNMDQIWENCYSERTFGQFKKEFFEQKYTVKGEEYHFAPRVKVEIQYNDDFSVVERKLTDFVEAFVSICEQHKNSDAKQFTQKDFSMELENLMGEKVLTKEKVTLLLQMFTMQADEKAEYTQARSRVRVLSSRKQRGSEEMIYYVKDHSYARLSSYFMRQLRDCAPNLDGVYHRFYPMAQNKSIDIMPILRLLELLELARYEIRGGEKAEIFVRINDPDKLARLANGRYTNEVLRDIQKKHQNSRAVLKAFFEGEMTTEERWELIEQYFLGNDEYVRRVLQLE
jgi:RecQ family ATP-dependent DNA helicase